MRICYLISGDLWAGAEVVNYHLIKGLQSFKDLEISVILLNYGKLAAELKKLCIPITVIPENKRNIFQTVHMIRKIINLGSPDIIHSQGFKENILAYLSTRNKKRIRLVSTQHGMPEPIINKYKILKKYIILKYQYYILSKYFNCIIAVSDDIKTNLIHNYNIKEDKILTINNGTYIPEIITSNNMKSNMKRKFVIGSAGRLYPIKDYTLMVKIALEVLNQTKDIMFELAGDGPEKENILAQIRDNKIENAFTLIGLIDDMTSFYQNLDLYINTSFHEGFPMSILEAMAHGLPVIAPNTGGLKEIIKNDSEGFLIDDRNPKAFAARCIELKNNHELLQKMGNASRDKIIKEYSAEIMAIKYHLFYNNTNNAHEYDVN